MQNSLHNSEVPFLTFSSEHMAHSFYALQNNTANSTHCPVDMILNQSHSLLCLVILLPHTHLSEF